MYFVEKTKGINLARQFDYLLFAAVFFLSIIGIFILSSATQTMPDGGNKIMTMQTIGLVMGVILAVFISTIDYKDFKTLGILFYIFSIFLLVIVLFKGSGEQLGSRSWLKIPGIGQFQPSELAKIAFVVVVSIFFERIKEGQIEKNYLKIFIYSILPVCLVLIQPDFGTAVVFFFAFAAMVFVGGIPYKYIIGTFVASIPLTVASWFWLQPYQQDRIKVFFNPELDPAGRGYNVLRSEMAIGSGQLYGKGLYQGIQNQNASVPVKESDFIFSVIGEELGFIGSAVIVGLLTLVIIRCIYIAKNSRDAYGAFVVTGLASMMAFHFFENVGMNIGLMPVTGIPLPFVSQGGTSMITNYLSIGIILSVSSRKKKVIFNN